MLALLLQGKPNKLIAREMHLSVETVKDHVAAVLRALGVSSRTQAVLAVARCRSPRGSARGSRLSASGGARQPERPLKPEPAAPPRRRAGPGRSRADPAADAGHAGRPAARHGAADARLPRRRRHHCRWPAGWRAARWSSGSAAPGALPAARPLGPGALALRWRLGMFSTAALWGASAWLFLDRQTDFHTVALITLIFAYCISAIPVLVTQPRTFGLFLALCLVPVILRIAVANDPDAPELRADHDDHLCAVGAGRAQLSSCLRPGARAAARNRAAGRSSCALQKAAADAARREAEVANRAKTQFLAAASHDLRQPLHALGLFAEALRGMSGKDDEVMHLVNSINSSVDALDGLFNELLDISKIDSGGVEAAPEHFNARRAVPQAQAPLRADGVREGPRPALSRRAAPRFRRPAAGRAHPAQPAINAIRYTDDGGVLVAARASAASGCGSRSGTPASASASTIANASSTSSTRSPATATKLAPHQRKGLGLGLAIVKRLADLMQAPLTLHSQPARGSVFMLELAASAARRAPAPNRRGAPLRPASRSTASACSSSRTSRQ